MKRVGPFSLHIRPVLVLGAPPQLSDTGAVAEHLDFRDLAISVLPTLWRYLRIRDVDPSFLDVKSESL
jgi:glutaredoxin-related protein